MINLLYYQQKQKKIANLLRDFILSYQTHPNISELWINALQQSEIDDSLLRQGQKIINAIRNNMIQDFRNIDIMILLSFFNKSIPNYMFNQETYSLYY